MKKHNNNSEETIQLNYAKVPNDDARRVLTAVKTLNTLIFIYTINLLCVAMYLTIVLNLVVYNYTSTPTLPFITGELIGCAYWGIIGSGLTAFMLSVKMQTDIKKHPINILLTFLTISLYPCSYIVPPAIIAIVQAKKFLSYCDLKAGFWGVSKAELNRWLEENYDFQMPINLKPRKHR